jgi:acyl carrier protein phosphodiesterase
MNFFAHACVALWRSDRPRFLLGAMLPDLTNMIGARLRSVQEPELAAGVAFHHETDAAFHAAPLFLELCTAGTATLGAAGVGRGTARAVAHVGSELLLDGALSRQWAARKAYVCALELATRERWVEQLVLESDQSKERLHEGLVRLTSAPLPESYAQPDFVVARLRNILAPRPRLAMQPQDLPSVQAFVRSSQPKIVRDWPELLEQVRAGLTSN